VANRGIYATLILLIHFFKWERALIGEEEKKHVIPAFRAARECSADMHPLDNTATPTEIQAIPWACGLKFTVRDSEALADWLGQEQ
jgi:phenylacetate 2-hydroxylase